MKNEAAVIFIFLALFVGFSIGAAVTPARLRRRHRDWTADERRKMFDG
jgi:hypothetical protein